MQVESTGHNLPEKRIMWRQCAYSEMEVADLFLGTESPGQRSPSMTRLPPLPSTTTATDHYNHQLADGCNRWLATIQHWLRPSNKLMISKLISRTLPVTKAVTACELGRLGSTPQPEESIGSTTADFRAWRPGVARCVTRHMRVVTHLLHPMPSHVKGG